MKNLRIAAFGFRSYPPRDGSAGADKFSSELLPRLAKLGHSVIAYNRIYPGDNNAIPDILNGVEIKSFTTTQRSGFDTLLHSSKVVWDIIVNNTADVVHIQNGGNSIFGAVLRLFGKKTFLSQDGLDWQRDKWPWYAKAFLKLSTYLTAYVHSAVIFDNIYARKTFENKFPRKTFEFIPFGSDVQYDPKAESILDKLGLKKGEYFLFVGRFIPDKGLHFLIPAFEALKTNKKLVLIGGSPNPTDYDKRLLETEDKRILFPGFLYGPEIHALMKNAYAYIQPSLIEGLSPVILEAAFLGAPIICSDIANNYFSLQNYAIYFKAGDVEDITMKLRWALDSPMTLEYFAKYASKRVTKNFSWSNCTEQHVSVFQGESLRND